MPEAIHFFDLTPAEIFLLFISMQAKRHEKALDRFLLSRLLALAIHCPERLPPPPPSPFFSASPMTDDEMKQRLLGWRRKDDA